MPNGFIEFFGICGKAVWQSLFVSQRKHEARYVAGTIHLAGHLAHLLQIDVLGGEANSNGRPEVTFSQ
ncbi:MAG: hypothetical protein M5U34_33335 [Chloroflexi bacterium]|nr:hypothetical protein [Chloroflexota bacterium]